MVHLAQALGMVPSFAPVDRALAALLLYCGSMNLRMFCRRDQSQILYPVVNRVAVYVMDVLMATQVTSQMRCHDRAVFVYPPPFRLTPTPDIGIHFHVCSACLSGREMRLWRLPHRKDGVRPTL